MADLDQILTEALRPTVSPPPVEGIRERGRHLRRRRRVGMAVLTLAAVGVVVGAGVAAQSWVADGSVVVDPVAPDAPESVEPDSPQPKTSETEASGAVLPAGDLVICQRDYDIYAVTLDGEEIPIFEAPTVEVSPDVSPDGKRIVFSSGDGDNFDLFVMAIDGTGVTQLTDTPIDPEYEARWSPDGSRIIYMRRNVSEERSEIWTMNADGSGQAALYVDAEASLVPTWSPDGASVAFTSYTGESFDVWVMDADGSDARPVTDLPYDEWNSSWSPDGRFLTFSAMPDGGDRDIYVVEIATGDVLLLVDTPRDASGPWWHPDGRRLAFERDRQIWIVEVTANGAGFDVSEPVQLTTGVRHGAPTWRPGS